MLPSFARQTVIRVRPGATTSRGSTIPDWSNTTQLTITGCSVQPAATSMTMDGRVEATSETLTAYLPENADVREGDHIIFEGVEYLIDGKPRKWQAALNLSNVQITLRKWEG